MIFVSKMSKYMEMLVSQKHSLGTKYEYGEHVLHCFDNFVYRYYPEFETVTKEISEKWAAKRPCESNHTQRLRITPVRDLAELMNKLGLCAYVFPLKQLPKERKYPAHIYTDEEIQAFFYQVDHCVYSVETPYRHMVMPILFRMMYCCGLRPGETRRLKVSDVDVENGVLRIIDSKNDNDRYVPMNAELTEMCKRYANKAHILSKPDSPFLLGYQDKCITNDNLNSNFRRFLRKAGISHGGRGKGPRPYDFRHTFAVKSLQKLVLSGKDMNAYYPVLQIYMGHSFFKYTEYYLRLTKDMYPEISEKIDQRFSHIIADASGGIYEIKSN